MKMEIEVVATEAGTVQSINVDKDATVIEGQLIATIG
jgi:biotin carboxyl carrier protein